MWSYTMYIHGPAHRGKGPQAKVPGHPSTLAPPTSTQMLAIESHPPLCLKLPSLLFSFSAMAVLFFYCELQHPFHVYIFDHLMEWQVNSEEGAAMLDLRNKKLLVFKLGRISFFFPYSPAPLQLKYRFCSQNSQFWFLGYQCIMTKLILNNKHFFYQIIFILLIVKIRVSVLFMQFICEFSSQLLDQYFTIRALVVHSSYHT